MEHCLQLEKGDSAACPWVCETLLCSSPTRVSTLGSPSSCSETPDLWRGEESQTARVHLSPRMCRDPLPLTTAYPDTATSVGSPTWRQRVSSPQVNFRAFALSWSSPRRYFWNLTGGACGCGSL